MKLLLMPHLFVILATPKGHPAASMTNKNLLWGRAKPAPRPHREYYSG
jgi:hypothetical protein